MKNITIVRWYDVWMDDEQVKILSEIYEHDDIVQNLLRMEITTLQAGRMVIQVK